MPDVRPTVCRICSSYCPILVTVDEGRVVKVVGDPEAPLYDRFTCPKGRAIPDQINHPDRLTHSVRREADGRFTPIASAQALDEIAARIDTIIAEHGPRAVAMYVGTGLVAFPGMVNVAHAWMSAIRSPMFFHVNTIDKPGMQIAQALHGTWEGGHPPFDRAEAFIMMGMNPLVSQLGGLPMQNPALRLKEAVVDRGMKLITIDPRRSETAERAFLHIAPKPGYDPAILASLIHVILKEGLYDREFTERHTIGFDRLSEVVAPFDPARVAAMCDVPTASLIEAARTFAAADYAGISLGTGTSFALHGTLCEYLAMNLMTLCGNWAREGDILQKPNVLLPPIAPRAQPLPPYPAWGNGEVLRVRGLQASVAGMPTAALPDEILMEGEGRVRALINLGGNPMMGWPDQKKTFEALKALDLLVSIDVEMSATCRLSDYTIAAKLPIETAGTSHLVEMSKFVGHMRGIEKPYARYIEPVIDVPEGSDLIEEWEIFYELARRQGLKLDIAIGYGYGTHQEAEPLRFTLDMANKPDTEELLEMMFANSRVPLSTVRQYPHGHVFEDVEIRIRPADPDNPHRMDLANPDMMAELDAIAAAPAHWDGDPDYPLLLISRRLKRVVNSIGRSLPALMRGKEFNPAYMNPDDMADMGLENGMTVRIRSRRGKITGIVEGDKTLRRGVLSMAHSFGLNPDEPEDPRGAGANTNMLISNDEEYDPICGIPRMSAIPITVEAIAETASEPVPAN